MPRKLRIQYPGAIYHVISRGDRREDIYLDDVDRHDFLKTLAEACQKTGWQVHAYCLMRTLQKDTPANRQEFERRMEARRLARGDQQALQALRRGWCLGSDDFRKQMLQKMENKLGDHHSGQLRRETAEAKAERIITDELRHLDWQEADLAARPKTDAAKLAIAARVRRETTLTIKAIAGRLRLGTPKSANIRLHALMTSTTPPPSQVRPGP